LPASTGKFGYGDASKLHPRSPRLDFEEACKVFEGIRIGGDGRIVV